MLEPATWFTVSLLTKHISAFATYSYAEGDVHAGAEGPHRAGPAAVPSGHPGLHAGHPGPAAPVAGGHELPARLVRSCAALVAVLCCG
jgi:hypothetical protein